MARKAKTVECDEQSRLELERLSKSQSTEMRLVRRARMVLGCLDGKQIRDISAELGEQEDVIIKWRDRFLAKGIGGLHDTTRPGKPVTYDVEWKKLVLEKLDEKPPNNLARWDGPTLAAELGTSEDAVQRFLKKEGIQLARMRTWCISTDPEFAAKAADIVGLYLNPPENAVVISVDEKPSIQALSRATGVVKTSNGKIVTAIKSTYKRNGTQNLFAALEVATGVVHGQATKTKKRVDFISFMDDVLAELQGSETTEYHVILDNYCIHKRCDEWLSKHPNVFFHYTPTSASWLNQIEIWFNIMTRKVLRGTSFDSTKALAEAIAGYISYYNESAEPFVWKKREVAGSQIKDKLSNLRGSTLEQWIKGRQCELAKATFDSYKAILEQQVIQFYASKGIVLSALRPADIIAYHQELRKRGVSENTVLRHHAVIHKALEDACYHELIPVNPATRVRRPRKEVYVTKPYTAQECRQLLDSIQGEKLEPIH